MAKEYRQHRPQRIKAIAMRNFYFQHHYGDNNRHHAIAEGFNPIFFPIPGTLLPNPTTTNISQSTTRMIVAITVQNS